MSYTTNILNGVTVTNAPTALGQVLVSTGLTTAAWAPLVTSPRNLGPLAFWLQRSNPGSGTIWNDVQNGFNATLTGATWVPQGVSFTGATTSSGLATSYGVGTISTLPQGAAPRTLAVRFNPVALSGFVFSSGTGAPNQAHNLALNPTNVTYTGNSSNCIANVTLPLNAWSVVSGSYDGTTAKLYVNGTLMASSALTWNTTGTSYHVAANNVAGSPFSGVISDILLYQSALNDTGHAQLAQMLA